MAIFVLDVTNKRVETIISLSLKVLSTMVGVGVGLAGLVLKRRADQQEQLAPPEAAAESRAYRVTAGEAWGEIESLDLYLRSVRRTLDDLRRDQAPFVPLTTSAESRTTDEELLPALEWQRREYSRHLTVAQPEQVELESIPVRFRRTAFLGEPGSGKSTCLIELARRQLRLVESAAVGRPGSSPDQKAVLPLYVSLSKWDNPRQSAMAFLQSQLESRLGPGNFFSRDFENQLAGGRFLLLLDGLNEIPHRRASAREGRHEQSDEGATSLRPQRPTADIDPRERSLRELADDHPLCHFVVTCRSHEYFDSLDWQVVRVLAMDSDQISAFVEAYLDPVAATQLQQEIQTNPTLAVIATNPFFLCSVIGAYEPGADLASRGVILQSLFTKLLRREQSKLDAEAPDGRQVASSAGTIAYRMLRRGQVGEHAPLPDTSDRDQESLDILVDTGLVIERSGQLYFRHQLVQEYFAAAGLQLRVVRRRPATLLADKRWSEVVGLWSDLDRRLDKRLARCLAARNLPWRRPRSYSTTALAVFEMLGGAAFVGVASSALLDILLWPATTLESPYGLVPVPPLVLAATLVALRLPWSWLVPHRRVVVNAAYVLGRTGYAAALPRMINAMGRVWQMERAEIAEAIAQFAADSLPHIDEGLRSRRWRVRAGSVQALGALAARFPDDDAVVDRLVVAAAADDPRLMRPLLEGLGRCRHSRARQALADLLARSGTAQPWATPTQLAPLRSLRVGGRDEPWEEGISRRFDELTAPTQPIYVRSVMLQAMESLRMPGSTDKLAAIAADADEPQELRNVAVSSLGHIGTSAAVVHLLRLAALPNVRESALRALDQVQDADALPELLTAATHPDWKVRIVVARALGRIGRADAIPVLASLVDDPDEDVRTEVARALAVAGHASAVPSLVRLVRDRHHQVREAALDSLTQSYPDLAEPVLLELSEDQAYKDRLTAVRSLADYDTPNVEKSLRRLGGDPDRQMSGLAQRVLKQVEARRHRGAQPWWRHPIARSRTFVLEQLRWKDLSSMHREEKLAGTPFGQRLSKIQNRINADAELTRQYWLFLRLLWWGFYWASVVGALLALLVLRLCLSGATLVVHHWRIVTILLLVGGATFLPGVKRRAHEGVIGAGIRIVRVLTVFIAIVVGLGALTYIWWIWLLLLITGGLVIALRYSWLCVRRGLRAARYSPRTSLTEATQS